MAYIYSLTDNWTDSATTWNGIKLAVTNTSSDAASKLLDLTVTGATTASFVVDKSGNLALNGSVNKVTITAPAAGATLTLADNSTFVTAGAYSTTLTSTGTTSLTLPTSGTVTALGNTTTGSGSIVLASAPTLTTPNLGTPSAATLTNATGLPAATGIANGALPSGVTINNANWSGTVLAVANGGTGTSSPGLVAGTNITITGTWPNQTINAAGGGGSMVYPGAGIAYSTGSAWGTSYTTSGTGTVLALTDSPVFNDDITVGTAGTATGVVKLNGTTSGTVSLSVADAAGTWTLKLPTTAGTNGYVLSTDGTGVTSWVAQSGGGGGSPGGSDTQVQFNDGGSTFGGDAGFTYNKTTDSVTIAGNVSGGTFNKVTVTAPATGATLTLADNSTLATSGANSITLTSTGATNVTLPTSGTLLAGTVAIANGGTGQTSQQTAINALAGAVTNGYFLRGNGTNVVMNSIQVSDVPTLNQNTTGTAANVTGTVAVANGGTGVSSAGITAFANITGYQASGATGTTTTNLVFSTNPTLTTPRLAGSSTGYTTFASANAGASNFTITFPAATGDALTTAATANIAKGFTLTPHNITSWTSFTVDPTNGNYQYGTNNGAITITAPTSDCAVDILIQNTTGAGTITLSGFTVVSANTGQTPPTTTTGKWVLSIRRISGVSSYVVNVITA